MEEEAEITCPFCGEEISILVDCSLGPHEIQADIQEQAQDYIEDCSVCCRPIHLQIRCADGALVSVDASR